jgi:hypothetical protein
MRELTKLDCTAEAERLCEADSGKKAWRRWGTYVSERQWGTVREDYSANGDAWNYFPHDHARSRAYRWGEVRKSGATSLFPPSDNRLRLIDSCGRPDSHRESKQLYT